MSHLTQYRHRDKIRKTYRRDGMKYEDLKQLWGTQVEIARALGIHQPAVSAWKAKGIPIERQWQIQLLTGGKLQADTVRPEAAA